MALSDLDKQRALAALQGGELTQFTPEGAEALAAQEALGGQTPPPQTWGLQQDSTGGRAVPLGADQTEPPPIQEGRASTALSEDISGGATADAALDELILGGPQTYRRPAQVIEAGENPAAVGGTRGRDRFDTAFDRAPALAVEAVGEAGEANAGEAKDLEAFYKSEQERAAGVQANINARRQEDVAGEQQRQAQLEQQTAKYSQNLSDRGSFWKNPGNIISAIGFALMPFASEDKAIGIKLLNNAISADFNQRKQLADSHLGELRSNLQGYRQIAGDRQAGDLLAQAEAYRVAAMEVQRIAAAYQAPKAIAAAKAMVADLTGKANITAMQAYRQMMYVSPQVMTPQMQQAYRGLPGYESFRQQSPQSTAQGTGGAAIPGVPGTATGATGAPRASGPTGANQGLLSVGQGPIPANQQKSPREQNLDLVESRSPGLRNLARTFSDQLDLLARNSVQNPDLHPEAVRVKKAELLQSLKAKTEEISKQVQPNEKGITGSAMLQKDIADLESAFGGDYDKINSFLGMFRGHIPRESDIDNALIKAGVGTDKTARTRQAAVRFAQVLQGNINQYYRDISGGAVTTTEDERLKKVISDRSPFQLIKSWANDVSRRNAGELKNALAGYHPIAQQYYMLRMGQRMPGLNSPGAQ